MMKRDTAGTSAADLKLLQLCGEFIQELQIEKRH